MLGNYLQQTTSADVIFQMHFFLHAYKIVNVFSSISLKIYIEHPQHNLAVTSDFQQCGILTSLDSDEPMQPLLKLGNS